MPQQIITYLHHIPVGTWQALGVVAVQSPALKAVKHWLDIQSEKVMIGLVLLVSFIAATGGYLLSTPSASPTIIALHTAVLGGLSTPFYVYIVKPLWSVFVSDPRISQIESEVRSAAEPAGGVPLSSSANTLAATISTQDFSH